MSSVTIHRRDVKLVQFNRLKYKNIADERFCIWNGWRKRQNKGLVTCAKNKSSFKKKRRNDDGKHKGARRLVTNVTHEQVPLAVLSSSSFLTSSSSFSFLLFWPLRLATLPGILISTFDVMPNTYPYSSGIRQRATGAAIGDGSNEIGKEEK